MVSRLTDSKGIGMVKEIADKLAAEGVQLSVLGTGDKVYEDYLVSCRSDIRAR
jgi:starch synthase